MIVYSREWREGVIQARGDGMYYEPRWVQWMWYKEKEECLTPHIYLATKTSLRTRMLCISIFTIFFLGLAQAEKAEKLLGKPARSDF